MKENRELRIDTPWKSSEGQHDFPGYVQIPHEHGLRYAYGGAGKGQEAFRLNVIGNSVKTVYLHGSYRSCFKSLYRYLLPMWEKGRKSRLPPNYLLWMKLGGG